MAAIARRIRVSIACRVPQTRFWFVGLTTSFGLRHFGHFGGLPVSIKLRIGILSLWITPTLQQETGSRPGRRKFHIPQNRDSEGCGTVDAGGVRPADVRRYFNPSVGILVCGIPTVQLTPLLSVYESFKTTVGILQFVEPQSRWTG